ncbi:hypothetical protein F2P56_003869 [Juglans regia]|uniref:Uncharacterized protein LOC108985248 n=2 Tax=Juglans regia TaxID=51240 RepID=A0A2I4E0S9_JUGRE|nr:uncharacterized protein LOC108985248 [Juglans regia]KAF5477204.1 hypothetical protein F2P56_003869 [Juglans regia]
MKESTETIRAEEHWPNSLRDAEDFAKKCPECQEHELIPPCTPEELTSIVSPWPFTQWGLDLIGSFPVGRGGVKFVVVAVDYFTKWVEAEALTMITARAIMRFLWKSVVCQFGIPECYITDNSRQFNCSHFQEWTILKPLKALLVPVPPCGILNGPGELNLKPDLLQVLGAASKSGDHVVHVP